MKHILCGLDASTAKIAILIKDSCFNKSKIILNYIIPTCIPLDQFIIFNLKYQEHNKCTAAYAKEYLAELLPVLDDLQIKILLVADPLYFKYLTKNNKAEPYYGYVCETNITPYNHIQVILVPNYQAVLYNPLNQAKIDLGLKALESLIQKTYTPPGTNIIHSEYYPETPEEINVALYQLLYFKKLTCDIETKSLEFWNAGLSTISFAWNQHEGIAFAIDRGDNPHIVRSLLKTFLQQYTGILIYHNVGYDAKVLTYELWMKNLQDYPNMLKGINCLTKKFDDTKLITFLATNNAIENKLGLKYLAQEFAGNYTQEDIANTDNIPLPKLLRYNLVDCLSTWYVYNKYTPIMLDDQQEDLYFNLFKPTVKTLLQTELCGIPISPSKVQTAKQALSTIVNNCHIFLATSQVIKDFHHQQLIQKAKDKTALAKKKIYTIQDSVIACEFNPNSGPQLQALIYDYLNYPVLDLTDTKLPATGMKTLTKLINHASCDEHKQIFKTLIRLTQADKILTTFIPAFENAQQLPDGSWRLYGNFNLGGTQSMRLSSSQPNLQNIPSNSKFSKLIKQCFVSTDKWIFMGSDFDSLEDKTNALITGDPNKQKVYTDGYDGHSLRAYTYFKDKMTGIDDTVDSINSIDTLYPTYRQASKAPTFALTYYGTYMTLMNNCGFSKAQAKKIESRYHELYQVADAWIADLITKAETCGYIPLAFGGRIRTPLLAQTIGNKKSTPYAAKKEARSAGNAATQSYCILTLRAMNKFMERVWASKYKYEILPSASIHDAIYVVTTNSIERTKWINDNLIECMAWQDLPELQHPIIKISSGLEIYYPSWADKISIPNKVSNQEIKAICRKQ